MKTLRNLFFIVDGWSLQYTRQITLWHSLETD